MSKYAQNTKVASASTLTEIQSLLARRGVRDFGQMTSDGAATVFFRKDGVNYKMSLPYPDPDSTEFTHTPQTQERRAEETRWRFYEQEVNRRFRALLIVIKAKLVAVDEGIVTFESEFLAHAVLSDGRTMMEHAQPALEAAGSGGPMTLALPGGDS